MNRDLHNVAASVHQRLLAKARATSRPFNELLQLFAIERFIYRLGRSPYVDRFVLKGAMMLQVWHGPGSRPTRDIDLLGRLDNQPDTIAAIMSDVCRLEVEADGMIYHADGLAVERIAEEAEYQGVRVRIRGNLGNARITIQVDIGFGDIVVPSPGQVTLPVLLDFPAPMLKGYSKESAIAEKLQTMFLRGGLNSRMKDFYDIRFLARTSDFQGKILAEAIRQTFKQRDTTITANSVIFDTAFAQDREKQLQWRAFIEKSLIDDAPQDFGEVTAAVRDFLQPLLASLEGLGTFSATWPPGGPWQNPEKV